MDTECEDLCERIIQEIDAVFHKDPDLSSFEITSMFVDENKSPVVHIEHNLGVESWCIDHVYQHAHRYVMMNKGGPQARGLNNKLLKYLNCALLLNPDMMTFWNIRRQMFEQNMLNIERELQFTAIVLSRKPKSNDTFAYRRWLFSFKSGESIDWTIEIGIAERCALKYASNYIAWSHRQWVLDKAPQLLPFEYNLTESFIRKRIGDYSSYSHRQIVISHMLELGYYNEEEQYAFIIELVNDILGHSCQHIDDVMTVLLPSAVPIKNIQSLFYCLNMAAYDLQLCRNLTATFGVREAFVNHRRAVLAFIVDNLAKLCTWETPSKLAEFLVALKRREASLGENERKWCEIFLVLDSNVLEET